MFRRVSTLGLSACFGAAAWGSRSSVARAEGKDGAFSQKEYRAFTLKSTTPVNHNTAVFRFALPKGHEGEKLDLPVTSCITCRIAGAGDGGKDVVRPYTPLKADAEGEMTLMIKRYKNGKMSSHIHSLNAGDTLECMGPWSKLPYARDKHRFVGLIAGGTGITPMLQFLEAALADPQDTTCFNLLFANVSEQDILMKERLDQLQTENPHRFRVFYIVDRAPPGWTGFEGYVTQDVVRRTMPPPRDDALICVCGPPGMMKAVSGDKKSPKDQGPLIGVLRDLGYEPSNVYKF